MLKVKNFPGVGEVRFASGAMLAVLLTGCVAYVDQPRSGGGYIPPPQDVTIVVEDDYVYYPGYDVYYNRNRRVYAYREGGVWVSRPQPRGVSTRVLFASPSVRMDFHDSPANHHTEVIQRYPKNWTPPGDNHGRKGNRPDENRDVRHENHGR